MTCMKISYLFRDSISLSVLNLEREKSEKMASKLLKLTETFVDISTVGVKWVHPVIGINVSVGA